ncbi:MAG: hypothetical protein OHK0022_36920 [Roseiflexaceae bacterium]
MDTTNTNSTSPPHQVTEIVGFDLGHGETALALLRLTSQAVNTEAPEIIEIYMEKSLTTAIAYHPQHGILISERALITTGVTESFLAFKRRPDGTAHYQRLLQDYVRTIHSYLVEQSKIAGGVHTHFIVGCPSGWFKEADTVEQYEQLLRDAGLASVTVVPESRAALMHAIESSILTMQQLTRPILVVDIGSSTTDMTLVHNLSAQPIDTGVDLGASRIDKAICEHTLQHHPQREKIEQLFEQNRVARNRCELLCRKVKESYFRYPENYAEPGEFVPASYRFQNGLMFEPMIDGSVMQQLLEQQLTGLNSGNKGWIACFREELEQVSRYGIEPGAVLLTGGASRMNFVKSVCEEVFPAAVYRMDNEPEFAIAKGLARWGRVYIRTEQFMDEINTFLGSQISAMIEQHWIALVQALAETFTDGLLEEAAIPAIREWRDHPEQFGKTILKLEERVSQRTREWFEGPLLAKRVKPTVVQWFAKIQVEVDRKTAPICQKYGLAPGAIGLSDIGSRFGASQLWEKGSLEDPTGLTNAIADIVVRILALGLVSGLGAIFAASGLGAIILIIVGIVVGMFALFWGGEVAIDKAKRQDIPDWLRRRLLPDNTLKDKLNTKRGELIEKFKEGITSDEAIKAQLISEISGRLRHAVRAKADSARILIR